MYENDVDDENDNDLTEKSSKAEKNIGIEADMKSSSNSSHAVSSNLNPSDQACISRKSIVSVSEVENAYKLNETFQMKESNNEAAKSNKILSMLKNNFRPDSCISSNFNFETITLLEENEKSDDNSSNDEIGGNILKGKSKTQMYKFKKVVVTLMLVKQWRKEMPRKILPSYRMTPTNNIILYKQLIEKKAAQTLESLVNKNKVYDAEYTPRLARVLAELIKNDAKSFKLELNRYKIVTQLMIIQKRMHQSATLISKELLNSETDRKIILKAESHMYHAICLIYLIYKD
jgi:hypothetical protein